ncbi:MAG: ZIP family metal transporter [Betaproteobacteria bacterium]|nr:ZIP family metal transporter [Betaproteobacteria bacterium]
MTLWATLLGTLGAGVGSVLLAALLSRALLGRYTQHLLSLAAGALLATAFMHLLPEAFESDINPQDLFMTLLLGLVFFFLLDKAELWHHGHEHGHSQSLDHSVHEQNHEDGHHGQSHDKGFAGSWSVLAGDSVHAFGDGILVAAAFMTDISLGAAASVAVLAHEIPHHMGDLAVLQQGFDQGRGALLKLCMAGGVTVLGGVIGHFVIEGHEAWLPFMLVVASSSYVYVALADLIPQLQKRLSAPATAMQVLWLFAGIALVTTASELMHTH